MRAPVCVVGLGNVLMGDEGVGVHVVRRLAEEAADWPQAEFLDLGTGGLTLLHAVAGRRKAIVVDCARMGATAGALRRFRAEEVRSTKMLLGASLHEGDVLQVLTLARRLGEAPADVVLFGIEPAEVAFSGKLSEPLAARFEEYVRRVRQELVEPLGDNHA